MNFRPRPPTLHLQRITTDYSDAEDRIRIAGESPDGGTVLLWLTRRLADRLVGHLGQWLESQHADLPRADLMQGFAQEKARRTLAPQPAVQAGSQSRRGLAQSIDVQADAEQVRLVFKAADFSAAIEFGSLPLRQWLEIVYRAYARGEWPLAVWPTWMQEDPAPPPTASAILWH